MNRVEAAISSSRCVLAFGARTLGDVETLGELRRRAGVPAVVLSGDAPSPATPVNADALAPALSKDGGVICLIDVDTVDAAGLNAIEAAVRAAPHKPRLVVVARAFNPFLLPPVLRLLKWEHEKAKPREFLQSLPVAAPAPVMVAAPAAAPAEEKKKPSNAPRVQFVGREEELASLGEMFGSGGPVAVVGPHGVGKRWLVEKALQGQAFTRLPDFSVGWGAEADSLYARIAYFGEKNGDRRLADALKDPASRPAPAALAALAVETLDTDAAANVVWVIERLEHSLRRDGTFHREGRLELLLRALLTSSYKARVVFLSTIRPRFYREGEGQSLRLLELGGLKGRELHEVFEAYRVEGFPREHFGDIVNRVHGHPFATRMFAIAVRGTEDPNELVENKRFMVMHDIADAEPLRRRIQKAVESLTEEEKKALFTLAHFRLPFTATDMEEVGVDRKTRLALLGKGVLDAGLEEGNDRTYRVPWLVQASLGERETSDYQLFESLGNLYLSRAAKAEGPAKLALAQEGNRLLYASHRIRNKMRTPYPDHDAALESVRGLVRSKKPRFDLAEQRIAECLKADPANTELLLMRAELLIATKAPPEKVAEAYTEAAKAPTPEVFHQEATWHQAKQGGRGRAAGALERGVAAFPESGRLRRRLAGVLVDQNRLDEAVEMLNAAMALEPMMPDTYGLLGEIQLLRGPAFYDAAEAALGEARRLDPDNSLHMARLGALMVSRGDLDEERRRAAIELLEGAISHDGKNYLAHLYLGRLVRAGESPDLDRADYLLKKAQKLDERAAMPLVERALVAIERNQWAEAEALLDKASRMDRACHEAWHARGMMLFKQGHIIPALSEFMRALELSPKETRARGEYEKIIAQCKVLIESGAHLELAKQAEAAGIAAPAEKPAGEAVRREPGKTTRRRRKKGGGGEAAAGAAEAGAEEAGGEGAAEEQAGEDAGGHEAAAEESAGDEAGAGEAGDDAHEPGDELGGEATSEPGSDTSDSSS